MEELILDQRVQELLKRLIEKASIDSPNSGNESLINQPQPVMNAIEDEQTISVGDTFGLAANPEMNFTIAGIDVQNGILRVTDANGVEGTLDLMAVLEEVVSGQLIKVGSKQTEVSVKAFIEKRKSELKKADELVDQSYIEPSIALNLLKQEIDAYNYYQASIADPQLSKELKYVLEEIRTDEVEHMYKLLTYLAGTNTDFDEQYRAIMQPGWEIVQSVGKKKKADAILRKEIGEYRVILTEGFWGTYLVMIIDSSSNDVYTGEYKSEIDGEMQYNNINTQEDIDRLVHQSMRIAVASKTKSVLELQKGGINTALLKMKRTYLTDKDGSRWIYESSSKGWNGAELLTFRRMADKRLVCEEIGVYYPGDLVEWEQTKQMIVPNWGIGRVEGEVVEAPGTYNIKDDDSGKVYQIPSVSLILKERTETKRKVGSKKTASAIDDALSNYVLLKQQIAEREKQVKELKAVSDQFKDQIQSMFGTLSKMGKFTEETEQYLIKISNSEKQTNISYKDLWEAALEKVNANTRQILEEQQAMAQEIAGTETRTKIDIEEKGGSKKNAGWLSDAWNWISDTVKGAWYALIDKIEGMLGSQETMLEDNLSSVQSIAQQIDDSNINADKRTSQVELIEPGQIFKFEISDTLPKETFTVDEVDPDEEIVYGSDMFGETKKYDVNYLLNGIQDGTIKKINKKKKAGFNDRVDSIIQENAPELTEAYNWADEGTMSIVDDAVALTLVKLLSKEFGDNLYYDGNTGTIQFEEFEAGKKKKTGSTVIQVKSLPGYSDFDADDFEAFMDTEGLQQSTRETLQSIINGQSLEDCNSMSLIALIEIIDKYNSEFIHALTAKIKHYLKGMGYFYYKDYSRKINKKNADEYKNVPDGWGEEQEQSTQTPNKNADERQDMEFNAVMDLWDGVSTNERLQFLEMYGEQPAMAQELAQMPSDELEVEDEFWAAFDQYMLEYAHTSNRSASYGDIIDTKDVGGYQITVYDAGDDADGKHYWNMEIAPVASTSEMSKWVYGQTSDTDKVMLAFDSLNTEEDVQKLIHEIQSSRRTAHVARCHKKDKKSAEDVWCVYSEDWSKLLGRYKTEEAAKKRLQQIEYFKRK